MSAIAPFFKNSIEDKSVIFTGDKAICRVPLRYQDKNLLIIDMQVSALGIFDIEVVDKGKTYHGGLLLPAMIQMDPVDTYQENIDGRVYFTCVLTKGSRMMTTRTVVQEDTMAYMMYVEGIYLGNFPSFITDDNIHTLYDDIKEVTDRKIPANHAILEIVYSELYRDPDDVTRPYRLSKMDKPPVVLPFRDVAHHTKSTHSRIVGGYADDGRNAALLNPNDRPNQMEDYFRN